MHSSFASVFVRIAVAVIALMSLEVQADVAYDSSEYSIRLDDDWVQIPLVAVDHQAYYSRKLQVMFKVVAAEGRARAERRALVASKMREEWIKRQLAESSDSNTKIVEESISEVGSAILAGFHGFDKATGRAFMFRAYVQTNKGVLIFFETTIERESSLRQIADSVVSRMTF